MRRSSTGPLTQAPRPRLVLVALGVAVAAMAALHVLQPELDPVAEPVSFYVWGRNGWLLPVALGAFGAALLALARGRATAPSTWPRRFMTLAGAALLLAAAIPSDRWFPWEHPPTLSGLVHAAAAMIAHPLLLWPMVHWTPTRHARLRRSLPWIVSGYGVTLIGSAASLAFGLWRDEAPPAIGLLERALAATAVTWVFAVTCERARE